jgi:hypothetical protein
MFESTSHHRGNQFYQVEPSEIEQAQETLGILFPKDLKTFYEEVGYGFLASSRDNFNRIMDPNSVCEFRTRTGQFAGYSELDDYKSDEIDKLIFFEICEGCYLSIGFAKDNQGKIFDGSNKIADSLSEFLDKYQADEGYFDE